ncbi:hypothetical protein ACFQL0_04265 [Haloplanus litoreus]|uniref:hypothetical protein n=1 Tax=Haloplanus litoreus TaxID=767515 RepID=UPI0036138C79
MVAAVLVSHVHRLAGDPAVDGVVVGAEVPEAESRSDIERPEVPVDGGVRGEGNEGDEGGRDEPGTVVATGEEAAEEGHAVGDVLQSRKKVRDQIPVE